jgi:putative membrane protein
MPEPMASGAVALRGAEARGIPPRPLNACQATTVPSDEGERDPDFPDYRFTLANERTFLAWMRTSLALLAGGIALRQVVPSFEIAHVRTTLAVVAVVLSLVLAVASYVRWNQIERAMRRGLPLPHALAVPVLATVIAAVAGTVAVVLLVR